MKLSSPLLKTALALALVTMLAACDSTPPSDSAASKGTPAAASPAPVATPAPAAPVTPEPAAAPIAADAPIRFEPASLSDCNEGEVIMVSWDANRYAGVSKVKIMVADGLGGENMFAATGVADQKATGPWATSSSEFVLRDFDTDAELARARVPGIPCAR